MALIAVAVGFGQARETVYRVGPFDRISQLGNINIVYRAVEDSIGLAVYRSDRDYSDAIEISNTKGKLNVREVKQHSPEEMPVLYVYSDYITQITNEGNATIEADMSITTPTLSLNLVGNGSIICHGVSATEVTASLNTGNGTIVIEGRCEDADFKFTGTGVIQADELRAESVKCYTLGTGSIGCWAVKNLDVRGVGTTKIYYKGNPTVKKVGGANLSPIVDATPANED